MADVDPYRGGVHCDPPLRLSDPPRNPGDQPGLLHDILVYGLHKHQVDAFEFDMHRYYSGLWGVLDPLPSYVGKGTDYNRLNTKRRKPGSQPPPDAADPDEPDWKMVRLAQGVESLDALHQWFLQRRILDKWSLEKCAEHEYCRKTRRWASVTWGWLVTRLYYRARGLCE